MSAVFEKIMEDLVNGSTALESACELLASASRADPQATRFWPQRIESEISRGRISASVGRSLFDALDHCQSDRTVWLDAEAAVPIHASGRAVPSQHPLADIEQMRAALFDPIARPSSPEGSRASTPRTDIEPASPPPSRDIELPVPALGTEIKGRYRLTAHLGLGGVGQVFDAVDLRRSRKEERHVTVKLVAVNLRHQPHAFAALEIAARRSQPLEHPNIAAVYDIDRDGDRVFVIMEPLRGRWLSQLIREVRGEGLAYEVAWPIVSGIALGLAHAHRHGVLHHDLSPHSVFVCEDGSPKIMGFGLLHAAPNSNESLDVLDTLTLRAYSEAYTADPWGRQSTPHASDDLYPLGVIAYEMLTGTHPFQRYNLTQARQKKLSYARIPGLNRRAHTLIDRCLSFERDRRPHDAGGFIRRMQPSVLQRMLLRTM